MIVMEFEVKICTKCGIEKLINEFYLTKWEKRRVGSCKVCSSISKKLWRKLNKRDTYKTNKDWRERNREVLKKKRDNYRRKNKKMLAKQQKDLRERNKEMLAKQQKDWRKRNKEDIKRKNKEWYNKNGPAYYRGYYRKRKGDINFKISGNLRSRIYSVIRGGFKPGSAVKDLGCTVEFLKQHLEQKFYDDLGDGREMNWDNYGRWHIDHIKPLSLFDLSDREQFLEACHYTNLQPLWAKDNLSKGAKYNE